MQFAMAAIATSQPANPSRWHLRTPLISGIYPKPLGPKEGVYIRVQCHGGENSKLENLIFSIDILIIGYIGVPKLFLEPEKI